MYKRYETIRRVTITFDKKESNQTFEWCSRNGYKIIYVGYTRDRKKRKLIAEKPIKRVTKEEENAKQ